MAEQMQQFSWAALSVLHCLPKDGGFAGGNVGIPYGPVLKTVLAYCIRMA